MIKSFSCPETEKIFRREFSKKFPNEIQKRVFTKLNAIDAATKLDDLRMPPSNQLEALKGNLQGYHSIRVNTQWRICFVWAEEGVTGVSLVDYHIRRTHEKTTN